MQKENLSERLMAAANASILLLIVLLYVVTGTGVGDDAVSKLLGGTVYRGRENDAVALECVVSWDAVSVERMLDTLEEYDTKITFFVSGRWARDNAKLLRRMAEAGHEIGSAGYTPAIDGDVPLIVSDIEASVAVIGEITGRDTEYYHSGLRERAVSERAAGTLGVRHIACTVDLLSGRGDAADIALRASTGAFDGSIILMHPTAAAADALPAILEEMAARGLAVTTVGEILK